MHIEWREREIPLPPVAVVAVGEAAKALGRRLLRYEDAALKRLEGVSGGDCLAAIGAAGDLPWVDGALYLGSQTGLPEVLMPTTLEPNISAALLLEALRMRMGELKPPVALLPAEGLALSLASARTIARETLQKWMEGRS